MQSQTVINRIDSGTLIAASSNGDMIFVASFDPG
jgi:hypothetical protein